jgi:hypothetical protein
MVEDLEKLKIYLKAEYQKTFSIFGLIFGLYLLFSFIPTKLVPIKNRIYVEDNLSLIISMGWIIWLLITLLFFMLLVYFLLKSSMILELRKDINYQETNTIEGKVYDKISNRISNVYEIEVLEKSGNKKKIRMDRFQFIKFTEGENVNISYFKYSKLLTNYTKTPQIHS